MVTVELTLQQTELGSLRGLDGCLQPGDHGDLHPDHGRSKSVSATFTQDVYALTITPPTGGTITADPLPPYHLNGEVTLTAAPALGWSFSAWNG